MTRLQLIEKGLESINDVVFQELCDSFLLRQNKNYRAFSRIGSQSGKQKSTVGTPDSLLLLPCGNYMMIEHSTNISKGLSKLIDDVQKCLDHEKTSIPLKKIKEIVLCINFNLKNHEIEQLNNLVKNTYIELTIHTLDSLALEINFHHKDIASEYFDLPYDTGQILTLDRFVHSYNRASKGIATPLDNEFLHRENEVKNLTDAINSCDFVILTGAAGVGKTKLAIETIKLFLNNHSSFSCYCISYKGDTLLNELYHQIQEDKDYILFVDDANRIDRFRQISGFYESPRNGKLKIVITVRDYAFDQVKHLCQEFIPKQITVNKFTDDQIKDIIESKSFEILNPDYQQPILSIADGNPRLAIMTSILAKEKQKIAALNDVSELFETYFVSILKDEKNIDNHDNIKCLGIISFFYSLPYKNKETLIPILSKFELDYNTFINCINNLEKIELVEIQYKHVKIPEQNLSSFFFYKAFIKEKYLSFTVLLSHFYSKNKDRFKDCIISTNNMFGPKKIMQKLKPDLKSYYHQIKNNNEEALNLLHSFWFYLLDESLEFIYSYISTKSIVEHPSYDVTYEDNQYSYPNNDIIELAGNLFKFPIEQLDDALELGFEYVRRFPTYLPKLIYLIRKEFSFDKDDYYSDFIRQEKLFSYLTKGLNEGDYLISITFFELAKSFLDFNYRQTKGGRKNSIIFYNYPIPNNSQIQKFREKIWVNLDSHFKHFPEKAFDALKDYFSITLDINKDLMEFDLDFIVQIIYNHLNYKLFEHCLFVQKLIRWNQRKSIDHASFKNFKSLFTNPIYDTYCIIDWDRHRDRECYDFEDHSEYEKLKETEIRNSFIFKNKNDIYTFLEQYSYLKKQMKKEYYYNRSLDYIIDENCNRSFEIGCQVLNHIIKDNNKIQFKPWNVFRFQLNEKKKADKLFQIIQSRNYELKESWEFNFYKHLDSKLIEPKYINSILTTTSNINTQLTIDFDGLDRYLKFDDSLFQKMLVQIHEKNLSEEFKVTVWMTFFEEHLDKIEDNLDFIEKIYLQQISLDPHIDYKNDCLKRIIQKDYSFLTRYISHLFKTKSESLKEKELNLNFIWEYENIQDRLVQSFDYAIDNDPTFYFRKHFCNIFFKNLQAPSINKASQFLFKYAAKNFNNRDRMNAIVDIARHNMKSDFEKILIQHVSLNQDAELFSQIYWCGTGGTYHGDAIIGDIDATQWRNILTIVEKAKLGIKLIPIKKYINERIESGLRRGDFERQQKYISS